MIEPEEKIRRGIWKYINSTTIGLLFLGTAVCISVYRVMTIQRDLFESDKKTIRISHWQLELGYRNAVQAVIDEYEKLHPDVRVIQVPISEKFYGQLLNTHLLSGTAPDISEMGFAKLAQDDSYVARFYLPLTELSDQPNPYNRGTPLEKLPWRETFIDGMRGGYSETLQDYYGAPTSMFTLRLFYNKRLLKEATGSDQPPKSLGEMLEVCRRIRQYGRDSGRKLVPISGSRYNVSPFQSRYHVAFTAGFEDELDINMDGGISGEESFIGFLRKQISMETPGIRSYFECMRGICDQFTEGFMGMGREQAAFTFVMGDAGMIASGSWDAMSLFEQAQFDVGIIDFPLPAKGEMWHEYVAGRVNEAGATGGGKYGIYKYSKNVDLAIDFLQFITSQKANQLLNQKADWIPAVLGAMPSLRMMPFVPNPEGFNTAVPFEFGNQVQAVYMGKLGMYLQGEMNSYEAFGEAYMKALMDKNSGGDRAWAIDYDTSRRWCRSQDRVLSLLDIRFLMDPQSQEDVPVKYRRVLSQIIRNNNGQYLRYLYKVVHNGEEIPEI